MSFLTDLFGGNISNLGNDLAPSNVFSDTATDIAKNPALDAAALIGGGLLTAGLADPALLGFGAASGAVDAALPTAVAEAAPAADLGAASAAASPLDFAALPAASTLDAGTVPADLTTAFNSAFPGAGAGATGTAATGTAAAPATWLDTITAAPTGVVPSAGFTVPPAAQPGILQSITDTLSPVASTLKTLSPVVGAGALGLNLYEGYEQKQALNSLNSQEAANAATAAQIATTAQQAAAPLINSGETLTQFLTTNTLPPAFQATLKQQIDAAKAGVIQGYASRGMSTDPTKNSALQQDLSNIDLQAQSLQANLESTLSTAGNQMITTANQLLAQGLSGTQISSELPIQVAQLNSQLNQQMSTAVSNFAAAVNGSGAKPGQYTLSLNSSGAIA